MNIPHDFPNIPGAQDWPMTPPQNTDAPELPSGKTWPKITIVTPSFNQGPYLEKTIRSVLLQGYPNLEYIVIDGGSTDQSLEVIKKYEPWISWWVSEKDRGQSHAINKGLGRATGELFGWLNSDDWYTCGALYAAASAYLEDKTVGAIYGQGHIVDQSGNITHIPRLVQIDRQSLLGWGTETDFMQPSCLFTKKAWLGCGPLDEGLNYSLDVDLWLKISEQYQFREIESLLSISLAHSNAKTTEMRNAMYVDLAVVLMRYGGEIQARKVLNNIVRRLDRFDRIDASIDKIPMLRLLLNCLQRFIKI